MSKQIVHKPFSSSPSENGTQYVVAAIFHWSSEPMSLLASAKEPCLAITSAASFNITTYKSPPALPRCHVHHVSLYRTPSVPKFLS